MVNNPLQLVGMSSVAGGGPPNFLGGLAPPPSGQQVIQWLMIMFKCDISL